MKNISADLGLLLLRVCSGGFMLIFHGWAKLTNFNSMIGSFPDPIGLGSGLSLGLATFAEFFCSLLVLLGIFPRFAAIPPVITMLVAGLIVHASDPWSRKELPFLYLGLFLAVICLGGGKFSVFKAKSIPSS